MNPDIIFEVRYSTGKKIIGYERINDKGQWEQKRIGRNKWILGVISDGQSYAEMIRRQYTGLNDRTGKETYDGDEIIDLRQSIRGIISFDAGCFSVKITEVSQRANKKIGWDLGQTPPLYEFNDIELTGKNIIDNPELLK
jgi:hypothetical protein